MKISKKDALEWFEFFAELPEDEELMPRQQEIVFATLAQLETAINKRIDEGFSCIKNLKTLADRTYYVGSDDKFPAGCRSCLMGTGLSAIRKTNRCNLQCRFCYDYGVTDMLPPVGEGMWEIGGTRFYEHDIPLLLSIQPKPTGISYVYLEPFMEIEKYYGVIRIFRKHGIHQHMYTNGTLATAENLKALGDAGLDELRFNLGASNCADRVIENIAIAKRFIPRVGIETPMTPELYEGFLKKRGAILKTGLDFINFAELHLNANNIDNYEGESMYVSRHGYISPIWSHELTVKMMKLAEDESWQCVVHDCSNHTKFARDLNLRAKEGGWFGASSYASEFDTLPYYALLPALRDESIVFAEEDELPEGYRIGDLF